MISIDVGQDKLLTFYLGEVPNGNCGWELIRRSNVCSKSNATIIDRRKSGKSGKSPCA